MSQQSSSVTQGFNQGISAALAPLVCIRFAMCCSAAFVSFIDNYQHRKLLDTYTIITSLATNGWCQLKLLAGEAFRSQGCVVPKAGPGGADGGIDLIQRKDERRALVQSKQWKRQQVGNSVVREIYGSLVHHN
ncbi:restriction endonuclease [Xanthomonas sp. WHRI 8932A]|uniref:restriction endonuclease n=1 Tax=unclassified Xanthomonas TaxID=2643310 RepID=UPI002B238289|nr:restriction endonuclease [Xanthomonas sp. WHRI 8932A]MEA9566841.1 restriction endonuclease [Xanthomonas sp. WHRI 8932A]